MSYIGDFSLGKTFDTKFTTVNTSGVPTTLAGTPVISAYVDNSLVQITAGITLTVDFDGVTGLHNVRVVATGGNGFATASNYQLVITTGTVGGSSVVGYVVAEFSIEARSALRPTTADRTLDVTAAGEAGLDLDNTAGTLGVAEIPNLDAAITSRLAPTVAGRTLDIAATGEAGLDLDNTVGTLSAAEIPNLDAAITSRLAPTVAGRTLDVTVAGEAGIDLDNTSGTLSAAEIPNLDAAVTTRLAPTVAGRTLDVAVGGEAGIDLDNALGALGTAQFDAAFLTAALLAADAGAEIADAVWDELIAGHLGAGSTGLELSDKADASALATVQADTDDIQTRIPAALVGGRMDSSVGAMVAGIITALVIATGAVDADALATDAGQEIADRILLRSLASGADGGRTVQEALRILRNRRAIAAGTLTVYEEDDATVDWTAAVATAAGDPVSSIDPA